MRTWMRLVGFGSALAVAPAFSGLFALAQVLEGAKPVAARGALGAPRQWIMASVRPRPMARPFAVTYRIPLWVSVEESDLMQLELDAVLVEVNTIWAQAGICFEPRQAQRGEAAPSELLLRFISGGDDLPLMGMYDGNLDMWVRDRPALEPSPHATDLPASRTAAHELGHALSLEHHDGRDDSIDSLMASGNRGFRLHPSEIARARLTARALGTANAPCARGRVRQRS